MNGEYINACLLCGTALRLTLAKTACSRHLDADGKVILREVLLNEALTMSAQSGLSIMTVMECGRRREHDACHAARTSSSLSFSQRYSCLARHMKEERAIERGCEDGRNDTALFT